MPWWEQLLVRRDVLWDFGQIMEVTRPRQRLAGSTDAVLFGLFAAIASHDHPETARRLDAVPDLALRPIGTGASRQDPDTYFLGAIHHYVYAGDTALHVAAAAHNAPLARSLIARGADVRARNRRGAEPIHYAADGTPDPASESRDSQGEVIALLIGAGADPNAMDRSGVAPLHRAVRNRCSGAVSALISQGADLHLMNKSGSTPLHLAVQNTGKSNSGSDAAKEEQHRIVTLLLEHGASPDDLDANGKTVADAASSEWVRQLLISR